MKSHPLTFSSPAGCHLRWQATFIFMAVAWLGAATAALSEESQAPKRGPATDEKITSAVDYRLLTDAALINCEVFAKTNEGIVTLEGKVNHLLARERAVKLAQTIRGVRGVVNTIKLDIPAVPDEELQKSVKSALHFDAATRAYKIEPAVKDGVVTLSGTVPFYCEMQLAEFIVKGVKGVRDVKDEITVTAREKRSDAEVLEEVTNLIHNDVWLDPDFISVAVKDGDVTLEGAVGSKAQYERARMVALDAGVKSVNTEKLQIKPWARATSQRSETTVVRSDEQILQAVKDSFVNDPRVYAFNPEVRVADSIVTLTGVVDNLKALRAAGQDAMNVSGVWRVMNLLKVRPVKPAADDELTQEVNAALRLSPTLEEDAIVATARRGVVTLTGTVNTFFESSEAEDIVSRASGVIEVKNELVVSSPLKAHYSTDFSPHWNYRPYYLDRPPYVSNWPYIGDHELKYDIENAFYWSPWVVRDDITVKVDNGVVTLTGKAGSWFAYRKASEMAYEAGAIQVFNKLTVE